MSIWNLHKKFQLSSAMGLRDFDLQSQPTLMGGEPINCRALWGDSGQVAGDGGQVAGDGGQVPGDGGQVSGDGGQVPGDGGQVPGDGGQVQGDGCQVPSDGGQVPCDGDLEVVVDQQVQAEGWRKGGLG